MTCFLLLIFLVTHVFLHVDAEYTFYRLETKQAPKPMHSDADWAFIERKKTLLLFPETSEEKCNGYFETKFTKEYLKVNDGQKVVVCVQRLDQNDDRDDDIDKVAHEIGSKLNTSLENSAIAFGSSNVVLSKTLLLARGLYSDGKNKFVLNTFLNSDPTVFNTTKTVHPVTAEWVDFVFSNIKENPTSMTAGKADNIFLFFINGGHDYKNSTYKCDDTNKQCIDKVAIDTYSESFNTQYEAYSCESVGDAYSRICGTNEDQKIYLGNIASYNDWSTSNQKSRVFYVPIVNKTITTKPPVAGTDEPTGTYPTQQTDSSIPGGPLPSGTNPTHIPSTQNTNQPGTFPTNTYSTYTSSPNIQPENTYPPNTYPTSTPSPYPNPANTYTSSIPSTSYTHEGVSMTTSPSGSIPQHTSQAGMVTDQSGSTQTIGTIKPGDQTKTTPKPTTTTKKPTTKKPITTTKKPAKKSGASKLSMSDVITSLLMVVFIVF